jgi:hypothetical protein
LTDLAPIGSDRAAFHPTMAIRCTEVAMTYTSVELANTAVFLANTEGSGGIVCCRPRLDPALLILP